MLTMDERLYSSSFLLSYFSIEILKKNATSSFVLFKSFPLSNSFAKQYWSRTLLAASTHCLVLELSLFSSRDCKSSLDNEANLSFSPVLAILFLSKQTIVTSIKPEIKHQLQSLSIFLADCYKNQVQFISKKFLKPEAAICSHFDFFFTVQVQRSLLLMTGQQLSCDTIRVICIF